MQLSLGFQAEEPPVEFDRCGVCGEGFATQCVLPAGHPERRHIMEPVFIEEYWEE